MAERARLPRTAAPDQSEDSMIEVSAMGEVLADIGRPMSYSAGQTIVREGDKGATMYFVKSGVVELLVGEQLLDILEPGNVFGEMSVVDGEPRSATAVATNDCELLEVDNDGFEVLISRRPDIAVKVMKVMAQRIRRLNQVVAVR